MTKKELKKKKKESDSDRGDDDIATALIAMFAFG